MELKSLLDNANQLPQIPEVVQELIQSFNDESINMAEIAKSVSKDQVLSAKVLRMANSTHYAGNRNVASIDNAVVMLGFNSLRTLVLATGISGAFKPPEGFDIKEFWNQCFVTAGICKWIARFCDVDGDTAYTCGMMHNIGGIMIRVLVPEKASEIQKVVDKGANRTDIEMNQLGFDFTQVGAELARRWKFPDSIVDAISQQLRPGVGGEYSVLGAIIYLANYINTMNDQDDEEALLAQFPSAVASQIGIDLTKLMDTIEETRELGSVVEAL